MGKPLVFSHNFFLNKVFVSIFDACFLVLHSVVEVNKDDLSRFYARLVSLSGPSVTSS